MSSGSSLSALPPRSSSLSTFYQSSLPPSPSAARQPSSSISEGMYRTGASRWFAQRNHPTHLIQEQINLSEDGMDALDQHLAQLTARVGQAEKGTLQATQEAIATLAPPNRQEKFDKMWRNAEKAIKERHLKDKQQIGSYATLEEGLPPIRALTDTVHNQYKLSFQYSSEANQGRRNTMEDVHFYKEIPQGSLAGVFDGHGGSLIVAHYVAKEFRDRFQRVLIAAQGNVRIAFESLVSQLHAEVIEKGKAEKDKPWDYIGTTAVVCFIDKHTHLIYTMSIGDSEASIHRKIGAHFKCIPISCLRNWGSEKDALRASIVLENPKIASDWPKHPNPKNLCFPVPRWGIRVSRSIGDAAFDSEKMVELTHRLAQSNHGPDERCLNYDKSSCYW